MALGPFVGFWIIVVGTHGFEMSNECLCSSQMIILQLCREPCEKWVLLVLTVPYGSPV